MKAAIFDMDGTLIDSMYYWRTVAVEYLREHGHEPSQALCEELYFTSVRSTPPPLFLLEERSIRISIVDSVL